MVDEKITAKRFWRGFCHEVNAQISEVQAKWENQPDFTEFILKEICDSVLQKMNCERQYEYFRIDLIGWNSLKDDKLGDPPKGLKKHFWELNVAIEHENNRTDWLDEIVKLSYINCPLRIVIGYAPTKNRQDYLDYAAKSLGLLNKRYQSVRKDQEFMLILGDSYLPGEAVSTINYTPYLYDPSEKIFINKNNDWIVMEN